MPKEMAVARVFESTTEKVSFLETAFAMAYSIFA